MKRYKCVEDLQGAKYMEGETKTVAEWREWLEGMTISRVENIIYFEGLEMRPEDHHIYKEVKNLKDKEIINFISKLYELKFEEVN